MGQPDHPGDSFLSPQARKFLPAFIDRYRYSSLGELLKGIVHNLNGSLQILSMQMELLQRMLAHEDEKIHEHLEKSLRQIDRFKEMLDLLIQKGIHDQQETPQPINLNSLLEEELSLLHHNLFFKHQVKVYRELFSPLPLLKGQYVDFSQGLSSLIQNALEAMENSNSKELTVKTRNEGDRIRVTIQDTGCGIAEDIKPRLFTPFLSNKGGKHRGVGLFIARELLAPYGAEFQYFSREGKTIFEVDFPLKFNPAP